MRSSRSLRAGVDADVSISACIGASSDGNINSYSVDPCASVSINASIDDRIDAITDVSIDDISDGSTDAMV